MKIWFVRSALPVLALSMLGLGAGAAVGGTVAASEGERRMPLAEVQAADHGADGLFSLEVDPVAVVQSGKGASQALEFEVTMVSHASQRSSHRWVYVLTDDRGQVITAPRKSELFRLDGRDDARSFTLRTAALADGYYSLRVTAAGSDGSDDSTVDAERFLRVRQGAVTPISFEEWSTKSRANRAIEG